MRKKYLATKKRAFEKGLDFDLTFDQYTFLKLNDCHYCGTPKLLLSHYCDAMGLKTPWMSLDRKNNKKGYTLDNVVCACFVCNRIKNNFFSYEDMVEIGKNFVAPKMKNFEQEALDSYQDWCDQNVYIPYDSDLEESDF